MGPVLLDVNIPMYAAGREHPLRAAAQQVILAVATSQLDAYTDVEVLQEILYRYLRSGEREPGLAVFDHFQRLMADRILPVTADDLRRVRSLADLHAALSPRDLVHLAVMQGNGLRTIITADRHFDGIDGIQRLDPANFTLAE